jgi:hypothetical protein
MTSVDACARVAASRSGWLDPVEEGERLGRVRAHQAFQTGLAVAETTLAALDGLADVDTVMRAVDAEESFATGLEWVLDAVAARLTPPPA